MIRFPTTLLKKFSIDKLYSNDNVVETKDGKLLWITDASFFYISRGPNGLKHDILYNRSFIDKEVATDVKLNDFKLPGLARAQNANLKYTDQLKKFLEENELEMPMAPTIIPEDVVDESGGVLAQYQLQYPVAFSIPFSKKDDEGGRMDDGKGTIIALRSGSLITLWL
jgi:hypothetical protein